MKDTKKHKPCVFILPDSFDVQFAKFYNHKELRQHLSRKIYSIKENDGATYRQINHWESIGLIDDVRESENDWRKFSICDMAWQQIILALREFGFPNEKIAIVKESLSISKPKNGVYYPFLDYWITAVLMRETVFLVVLNDGNASIGNNHQILMAEGVGFLKGHHLRINLNKIVQKFYKKDISPKQDLYHLPIDSQELDIIEAVRAGNYESVKVKFNKGKVDVMEKTEDINIEQKIIEILKESKFQNIEIRQKDDKVVSIKRTTQKKL
jgi:DNA-binding transcriptional MerR regulator